MTITTGLPRHGRIDDVGDLEELDLVAFNDGVNPYGDAFITVGFRLGRDHLRKSIAHWGFENLGAVADIGCGFGRWSMFLAEVNDRVVGYDRNKGCTELATRLAAHLALDNASFEAADVGALPAPDASFDGAWCFCALPWMDSGKVLAEVGRVVKPGGLLYIGDHYGAASYLETFLRGYSLGGIGHRISQFALAGLAAGPFFDKRGNYASPEHMAEMLDRHGFALKSDPPMDVRTDRKPEAARGDVEKITDIAAFARRLLTDAALAERFAQAPGAMWDLPLLVNAVAVRK